MAPTESNDTIALASDTALVGGQSGTFSTSGAIGDNNNIAAGLDVDLYKLQLNQKDRVFVDIDALSISSSLNPVIRLFDAGGSWLRFALDPSGTFDRPLDFTARDSGTYYVGISGFSNTDYDPTTAASGNPGTTGNYNLKITLGAPLVLNGTSDNDTLTGGEGNDSLSGLALSDRLSGRGGNDTLSGGTGNDRLLGEAEDDSLSGGAGNDNLDGGVGSDTLFGGAGNDTLNGGNRSPDTFSENALYGEDGNDRLISGNDSDSLFGGRGNDTLNGGDSFDTLFGGDGSDRLVGGNDFDELNGGSGNDTLIGVAIATSSNRSTDSLTGGVGSDRFVLGDRTRVYHDDGDPTSRGSFDRAIIFDLNVNEDVIQLKGSAAQYRLDFFTNDESGRFANLIYDTGANDRGELIAILQNVSTSLSLTSSAFTYV
jgi:serralysin